MSERYDNCEQLFPEETVPLPLQRLSPEDYADFVLRAVAQEGQLFPDEAVLSTLQESSPDEYADFVLQAVVKKVAGELADDFVEQFSEFGRIPGRHLLECVIEHDEWERSKKVIEMTNIAQHNIRVKNSGVGERIPLGVDMTDDIREARWLV